MKNEELLSLSAVEMRRQIGARQISVPELVDACIERIERINPAVNAVTATCFDRARQEAQHAQQQVMRGETLGLLHGLPLGVKDLEDTEGLLSTYGSPRFRGNVPAQDNALVAGLRQAGAIVLGKTNVPEMGAGANSRNPVWGATGNAFNPELNAGGSSGGSAVALALDMMPLCTGSDTGGSLRIPASLNGVVGFRPSPGLVPVDRRQLGWTPISVVGPMGRNVEDTCLQLAASIRLDDRDPLSCQADGTPFLSPEFVDLAGLRVGYTEDFGVCPVDNSIRAVFRERIDAMRHLFRSCEPITPDMGEADRCFDVVRAMGFVAGFSEAYEKERELLGPNIVANYEMGAAMSMADVTWSHLEQTRIFRRFQRLYDEVDVIISPTTPVSPFPWTQLYLEEINGQKARNYYHWLGLTYVITLVTNPALSLPCGVDHQGMPFGLQLTGRHRGDLELLRLSRSLEAALAGNPATSRPRPDLSALGTARPELRSIVTHPPVLDAKTGGAAHAPV